MHSTTDKQKRSPFPLSQHLPRLRKQPRRKKQPLNRESLHCYSILSPHHLDNNITPTTHHLLTIRYLFLTLFRGFIAAHPTMDKRRRSPLSSSQHPPHLRQQQTERKKSNLSTSQPFTVFPSFLHTTSTIKPLRRPAIFDSPFSSPSSFLWLSCRAINYDLTKRSLFLCSIHLILLNLFAVSLWLHFPAFEARHRPFASPISIDNCRLGPRWCKNSLPKCNLGGCGRPRTNNFNQKKKNMEGRNASVLDASSMKFTGTCSTETNKRVLYAVYLEVLLKCIVS